MRRPIVRIALLVVLAAIGGYVLFVVWKNDSLGKKFETVSEGASKAQVLALMGSPDLVRMECRDAPRWLDRAVVGKTCASELQYNAKHLPKFWTIGFDAADVAIAKYEYVSP
jgi:hypothetical protein